MIRKLRPFVLFIFFASTLLAEPPIEIKAVVVAMFEIGEDTGDKPAEFQYWVERVPLEESVSFPQGFRDLRLNREKGILGIVTGIGTARSAASIMALGLDPRFDLTKAYWLVAGISGVDPKDASLGSAAWAEWLVDGDLAHQIDAREIEEGWPTGYIPLRKSKPYEQPLQADNEGAAFRLVPEFVEFAYQLTKDVEIPDTDAMRNLREKYVNFPNARKPPFVLKGDHLAAMTFWHGTMLNDWANDWVAYFSEGSGNFVTSAMEDTGSYSSLERLTHAGKADVSRMLVLRTASNFVMQHEGISAYQSLSGEKKGGYSAFIPSLEACYRVGMPVIDFILNDWETYSKRLPTVDDLK
ncbi:MAG: purine nucleoside permease [Opitutales bacterium]